MVLGEEVLWLDVLGFQRTELDADNVGDDGIPVDCCAFSVVLAIVFLVVNVVPIDGALEENGAFEGVDMEME